MQLPWPDRSRRRTGSRSAARPTACRRCRRWRCARHEIGAGLARHAGDEVDDGALGGAVVPGGQGIGGGRLRGGAGPAAKCERQHCEGGAAAESETMSCPIAVLLELVRFLNELAATNDRNLKFAALASPSQKPTSASAMEPLSALARLQRPSLAHADRPALQLLHHIIEIEACGFLPDREFLERLKPPSVDGEPLQTSGARPAFLRFARNRTTLRKASSAPLLDRGPTWQRDRLPKASRWLTPSARRGSLIRHAIRAG